MKKHLLLLLFLILSSFIAQAAYLTNIPRQIIQPNGDTLHCFLSGDEYHHWLHDKDGYTIIQDTQTGYYVYAQRSGDDLVPTPHIAGKVNPASVGLAPFQNISTALWQQKRKQMEAPASMMNATATKGEKNRGVINNIIIFINFADDGGFTKPYSEIEQMFNDSSANAVSMYNYFKQVSFGQLSTPSFFYPAPQDNKILSYTDTYTREYYCAYSPATNFIGYQNETERTEREHSLLERALKYVEPMIPDDLELDYNGDGQVDNVCFIIKGEVGDWNALLWPHKWNLYTRTCSLNNKRVNTYNLQLEGSPAYFNTSVLCHEMFHTLSAPDLYHYNDAYTSLTPVGRWDLMANNTNPPQQTAAYMKYKYGNWLDEIPTIKTNGIYTLYPGNSNRADKICYQMQCPGRTNEYYVFEYRRKSDPYDNTIYGSGLLVYRINRRASGNSNYNGTTSFDEVYLFRPNGTPKSNGDISNAHFDASKGRDHINSTTNPAPYFCDGTIDSLFNVSFISEPGDSLVFKIGNYYAQCTPDNVEFENKIQTSTLHLTSNTSWEIKGHEEADWLKISPLKGTGDTTLTISTTSTYNKIGTRNCEIKITSDSIQLPQPISITQQGIEPYLEVSTDTIFFDNKNLSHKLYIKGNVAWSISLVSKDPWVKIDKQEGIGTDTVTITATGTSKFSRSSILHLKNEYARLPEIIIQYKGIEPILYIDYPAEERVFEVPNKATTFKATLNTNMKWKISQNSFDWHNISPTSGTGTTELTITIKDTSTTVSGRKGNYTIEGEENYKESLVFYQQGIKFIASVNPNHVEIGNISGSTFNVNVKANDTWRTTGNASWYKSRIKNDTTLTISINTFNYTDEVLVDTLFVHHGSDNQRNNWIPVVISQKPSYIDLHKDTILVENKTGYTTKLKISSNSQWFVTGLCSWLSFSKRSGTGDQTVDVKVTETTKKERFCDITITDRKGTNKTLIVKQLTTVEMDDYLIQNIQVYPNPAHDVLNISNNQVMIDNVTIFDAQGRMVMKKENANSFSVTINTSSLDRGLYFVQVKGNGHVITKRVIVQ